jgi:hypothetical protein
MIILVQYKIHTFKHFLKDSLYLGDKKKIIENVGFVSPVFNLAVHNKQWTKIFKIFNIPVHKKWELK